MSASVSLPPLTADRSSVVGRSPHKETTPGSFQSSYRRDFQLKGRADRAAVRPTSTNRKHNPQPRHVFLLRRMFNEPVCNVWTPPERTATPTLSSIELAHKALMTCAQDSYQRPDGHPNFASKPTRFGANKQKKMPAFGIVPLSVWVGDLPQVPAELVAIDDGTEPLNMSMTNGKKRKLTAAYVLDQQLPQYKALQDMLTRVQSSKERYLSQAIQRPSRRKVVPPHPNSFSVAGGNSKGAGNVTDGSLRRREKAEFYSLHQPWPAVYSCWAGPI